MQVLLISKRWLPPSACHGMPRRLAKVELTHAAPRNRRPAMPARVQSRTPITQAMMARTNEKYTIVDGAWEIITRAREIP